MIYCTAYSQFNMGCPFLSLEILKCLKKGFTKVMRAEAKPEIIEDEDGEEDRRKNPLLLIRLG